VQGKSEKPRQPELEGTAPRERETSLMELHLVIFLSVSHCLSEIQGQSCWPQLDLVPTPQLGASMVRLGMARPPLCCQDAVRWGKGVWVWMQVDWTVNTCATCELR
jgi:hypothetical protein